jgi:hypothetical protein
MTGENPRPVADIDKQVTIGLREAHRLRWYIVGAIFGLLAAGISVLGILVIHQQSELRASCQFYASAANVPVTPVPPAVRPSELGVKIIASSRVAYYGQGCGGHLMPNPSLQHWASYYNVHYVS